MQVAIPAQSLRDLGSIVPEIRTLLLSILI